MTHPHAQVRDERTLDVSDGLLGSEFGGRQNVNLVHRTSGAGDNVRRHDPGKRPEKFFSALYWKHASGDQ
jgi:hypothetical protein